eukprot:5651392-Pyramimonas_sp.AAC.2
MSHARARLVVASQNKRSTGPPTKATPAFRAAALRRSPSMLRHSSPEKNVTPVTGAQGLRGNSLDVQRAGAVSRKIDRRARRRGACPFRARASAQRRLVGQA